MKYLEWILGCFAFAILIYFRIILSEEYVNPDLFWWIVGLYGVVVIALYVPYVAFRNGLIVSAIILMSLFGKLPLPYQWLITHETYFSISLIITALVILGYSALPILIIQYFAKNQVKRLHR